MTYPAQPILCSIHTPAIPAPTAEPKREDQRLVDPGVPESERGGDKDRDDHELPDLGAGVEGHKSRRQRLGGKSDLREHPGEAEAVDEPEAEGHGPFGTGQEGTDVVQGGGGLPEA